MKTEQHYHVGPSADGRWSVLLTRTRVNAYGYSEHVSTRRVRVDDTREAAQRASDKLNRGGRHA